MVPDSALVLIDKEDDIQKVQFSHSKGKAAPVEVVRLTELRARDMAVDISAPTRQDFYLLKFVTHGRGTHWVDFTQYPVRKGDVLQVRPDQIHAFDAQSKHEALLLVFRPETVSPELIQRLAVHLSEPINLDARDFAFLTELLEFLLKIGEVPNHLRLNSMAPGLLQAVIAGLDDLYSRVADQPNNRALDLVYRFEQILHREPGGRCSLADYAGALHVTPRTLARACHQIRGLSPKKLIDQHCVLEAKRKLILGDDTVEEIAFDLGFSEATNFVKFFKRIASETPEGFRSGQRNVSS